jgi:hypothetical protein
MMRKTCRICGVEKDVTDFYKKARYVLYTNSPAGFSHDCIPCDREKARKKRIENPDYQRAFDLRGKFGISIAEYDSMLAAQGERCGICQRHQSELSRRLAVDHNHSTGRVRGLLCNACNTSLGKLREDPEIINKMLEYISKHSEPRLE